MLSGVSNSLPPVPNSAQPSENSDQAQREEGATGIDKLPAELFPQIFEKLSFNELLAISSVSKPIYTQVSSFLLSNKYASLLRGYVQPNSPKDDSAVSLSEMLTVRGRLKKPYLSSCVDVYCRRVLSRQLPNQDKPSERIKLLEKLQSRQLTPDQRLEAVQDMGLLGKTEQEKTDNASLIGQAWRDYIQSENGKRYLTSEQNILERFELESQGVQFNLPAFLKVRFDLFEKEIIGALKELDQDNLTEERLSEVCEFLSSLCPKPAQENADYSEATLKGRLEKLEQLGLNDKNLAAIRLLIPMVECGGFANKIMDIADTDTQNRGITPIYWAVMNGNLTYTRILRAAGADLNRTNASTAYTLLHSKTLESRPEIARALLGNQTGLELDKRINLDAPDCEDYAPLARFARLYGAGTEMISVLLDAGAKIDRQDRQGKTATYHAIATDKSEVVRLFLERGADVDTLRTSDGKTAREFARELHEGGRWGNAENNPENIYQIISTMKPLPLPVNIDQTA